jgi:predicted ATP-grasp superfamily ATP-dependent carboligase
MQPCAIVIGGKLNGLGVCRSLARGGVISYVVDRSRSQAAMWSRHARPVMTQDLQGHPLLDCLLALQHGLKRRPFLVITDEMAVLTISEHRELLTGKFHFRLPPHDTVLMLYDKGRFHEFAMAADLPVPNGVIVGEPSELGRIRALRFPVIIKPTDKRQFHVGAAPRLAIARNIGEAFKAGEELLQTSARLVVQEKVDGPDDGIYFCLFYRGRGARTVAMFTGRKLASMPPGIGSTAFCEAAPPDARHILEALTRHFLERINYSGFGSVEYKWDPRTRRFVIIEPTVGRTDWQEESATLSGVNIPLEAYRHELGLSAERTGPTMQRIVWQGSYFNRLMLGSPCVAPDAIVYDGYWRFDDPLPAIIHYPLDACSVAGSRVARWLWSCFGNAQQHEDEWSRRKAH